VITTDFSHIDDILWDEVIGFLEISNGLIEKYGGRQCSSIDIDMIGSEAVTVVAPPAFVGKLREYVQKIKAKGRKPRTVREIERTNMKMYGMLMDAGLDTAPTRMGASEVNYLRGCFPPTRGNDRNAQYHIDQLGALLHFCGNDIVRDMDIPWTAKSVRIKADWLTVEAVESIREAIKGNPELEMIFHLEADLGFRRCEVSRASLSDFEDPLMVTVWGKGRGVLGKRREVRRHPETPAVLEAYLEYREREIIHPAIRELPGCVIPEGLLLYRHMGRVGVMQRTAIDRRIARIRELSGVYFGSHTLRRTWGRTLWLEGVPIETIAEMMGHEDTRTTLRYLGINAEDQGAAMNALYRKQMQIRAELRAKMASTVRPYQKMEARK